MLEKLYCAERSMIEVLDASASLLRSYRTTVQRRSQTLPALKRASFAMALFVGKK
jgi:hypothetical protein